MTSQPERSVAHATFSLERRYDAPPSRVFAAWADPAAKARWFAGPEAAHSMEFRVGGRERVMRPGGDGRPELAFESVYQEIVEEERIVYSATLSSGGTLATVSLTTVEIAPLGAGTQLRLTEQGAFLDGQ
ncbi:MAG: SRPBCC domain-containing protein, partial [bacterium]|nr:SRPBCC domain-containing protein [bacterium]